MINLGTEEIEKLREVCGFGYLTGKNSETRALRCQK